MISVDSVYKVLNCLNLQELRQLAHENRLSIAEKVNKKDIITSLLYPDWVLRGGAKEEITDSHGHNLDYFYKKCGHLNRFEGVQAEEALQENKLPYQDLITLDAIEPDDIIFINDRCYGKESLNMWVSTFKNQRIKPKIPPINYEPTLEDLQLLGLNPLDFRFTYRKEIEQSQPRMDNRLRKAIQNNDFSEFKSLVDQGIAINTRDEHSWTPLMIASQVGHLEIIKYLVEKGANVNAKNDNDHTSLIFATYFNRPEIIKYLVTKGASVNDQDINGKTPLMYASKDGNLPIVRYLVLNGADINITASDGKTAIDHAKNNQVAYYLNAMNV